MKSLLSSHFLSKNELFKSPYINVPVNKSVQLVVSTEITQVELCKFIL